ncbi:tRNA (cytidine(34)-2'-O)-methyltransferase [Gammaproteobacteria bacterium]|nr:tRNA (cytidine(34)-2'-O)-methyltransferase [Gammaproteobacteria bacterium]
MFNIVLHQPEIPPNTGNIIRLCANTGARLHLIHPLGFVMTKKNLERAALDYGESVEVIHHKNFEAFLSETSTKKYYSVSTKGEALMNENIIEPGDYLMFGSETKGLPQKCLNHDRCKGRIRIPMADGSRSLNLSNSVAILLYHALGQNDFTGLS